MLLPPCPAPIPIASSDRRDWAAKAGSRCGPPLPGHPGWVGASDLPLALEGPGAVSGHCPLLLIPAGKVTCSSSSGLEQGTGPGASGLGQSPPRLLGGVGKGPALSQCPTTPSTTAKGPGHGISCTRGVAPVHSEPLCLHPTGHMHPGVGRDTRVYRWEGTYKRARLGTAVCSHQEACCPCWVQEGPVPAKHRYSWTLRKRAAVRIGTKEATSQLGGLQRSLKLLCLWPHLRPARSHGGAHD